MVWEDKGVKYKVSVREPTWAEWTQLWEEFDSIPEAEGFIRDISYTYPEGTLLYITGIWSGTSRNPTGKFTRKAFIVDEYGQLRSMPRKWIPSGKIPREWIRETVEFPEPSKPEISDPEYVPHPIEGVLVEDPEVNVSRFETILWKLDPGIFRPREEYEAKVRDKERKLSKYGRDLERWKALKEQILYTPEDLPSDWSRFGE